MEINAFHIYWKNEKKERNFKDYFTLTALLSALEWKKNHKGNLTFYMDEYTSKFFEERNLLGAWDKIDNKTLDEEIDSNHFDTKTFYSIGKFIALQKEKIPTAMVDIDLITWKNIEDIIKDKKSAFTHYEKTTPFTIYYPDKDKIQKREDYEFLKQWDFTTKATNTSFIYFNDNKIKDYYTEQGINFMRDNYCNKERNNIGNPEVLFVEQRLLPLCYKDLGIEKDVTPLIDIEWDVYNGRFINKGRNWEFYELDNDDIIYHTWISKEHIDKDKKYEDYLCIRLIEKILELDDSYYDILKNIDSMKKYLSLLEKYKNSKELVKREMISDDLYGNKNKTIKKKLIQLKK